MKHLILCFLLSTFALSGCDQKTSPGSDATADRDARTREEEDRALAEFAQRYEARNKALEEKKSYISLVELSNVKVGEGQKRRSSDTEIGVFGTATNKGTRTLTRVKLTVYFLDDTGTVIGETDYPIVSEYSLLGDDKPLKPNYVKDFGFSVKDSAPSGWAKEIRAEITEIEFAE